MDNLRLILLVCGIALLAGIYFWGVTVAKRRRAGDDDEPAEAPDPGDDADIDDALERVQDLRAAENVESFGAIESFDIDAELDAIPEEIDHDAETIKRIPEPEAKAPEADVDDEKDTVRREPEPPPKPKTPTPREQMDLLPKKKAGPEAKKPGEAAPGDLVLAITVMAREGDRFEGADLKSWLEALKFQHGDMGIFHYRPPGRPSRTPPTFSVANVVKPGTFDPDGMAESSTPGVAMFVTLPGPDDPGAAFEEMLRTAKKLADGLGGVVCDETRSTLTGQVINHMRERIAEFSRRQRLRY